MKKWSALLGLFVAAALPAMDMEFENTIAKKETNNKSKPKVENTWKPSFTKACNLRAKNSAFFQFNVGVGFLYFSGVKGRLSGQPAQDFRPFNATPMDGRLGYNRTPHYEALVGYRIFQWFKPSLSYQYQGGVTIQTKMNRSSNPSAPIIDVAYAYSMFQANLSINTLMAKFFFQAPGAFIWKGFSTLPYLALGVGPAWQSWTRVQVKRSFQGSQAAVYFAETQFLRQKISANVAWMVDLGFQVQKQNPYHDFSFVLGCKYLQYGQARSMGKITQQDSFKGGLIDPVRIKTLYSFVPYLGVKWNFPVNIPPKFEVKGKSPNTFKPYYAALKGFDMTRGGFAQINVGPAFLYYNKLRGNLFGRSGANFGIWGSVMLRGPLSENKALLMEALWGYRFATWIRGALSYQHMCGMTLQTKMLSGTTLTGVAAASDYSQFQANLSLDSLALKVYFDLPWGLIFKGTSSNLYLAVGGGPSWQSWTRVQVNRTDRDAVGYTGDVQPIRQKTCANMQLLVDLGGRIKNLAPGNNFEMSAGCKFNLWGQARNLGDISQQDGMKVGLNHPIRIESVYTFSPYLGAQWNFPVGFTSKSAPKIQGKSIASWKPTFVHPTNVMPSKGAFIRWDVGIGFLYFSQIRGSLAGKPNALFIVYGDVPVKGSMSYNRTPVFEYMVGYKYFQWLKAALSYVHQGGVVFQTKVVRGMNPPPAGASITGQSSQLQANLSLDAILAKVYFEVPYSLIMKGTATTPYLGFAVGPSWQTWSRVQVNRMYLGPSFIGEPQELTQKISANAAFMVDAGVSTQSAAPNSPFTVAMGCKFMLWGQARSIGDITQQDNVRQGLAQPFKVKTVYSFAPYLGMQWNF